MKELLSMLQLLVMLLKAVGSVGYEVQELKIYDYPQRAFFLEVKPSEHIEISSVLSSDSLFGFEHLESMAMRKQAIAAVNGMFFDDLGSPAGLLCMNGKWIRISDIGTPCLIEESGFRLDTITVSAWLFAGGQKFELHAYNVGAYPGIPNVFTPEYGWHNRVYRPQIGYRIVNDKVVEILISDSPMIIGEGFLISYLLPKMMDFDQFIEIAPAGIPVLQLGDEVKISFEALDSEKKPIHPVGVYQSGGWLLRNQQIKAKKFENFIGPTSSLQPRTAIGIKADGNLVFAVVDGRDKGKAEGLSGIWLAEFLQKAKIKDAVYMDGGASSMIWLNGQMLNYPAFIDKNQGKKIAQAFLIRRKH